MRTKKRIIFTQIFVILTLFLVINTSRFDFATIPMSSVNNKGFTLNTAASWSNATAISDLYGWNDGISDSPSVAVDDSGNVHVVWKDETNGEWGTDDEIMYANYTAAGWSNATVISDDYTGWNNGISDSPSVAVDGSGNVHVVWADFTSGAWGFDPEILYINYTAAGWSNPIAISDPYGWNDGISYRPSIAVDDSDNVHVVWHDNTVGEWGTDIEIMYANYTAAGWSNATVISDDYTEWNNGHSYAPSVAVDDSGNVHVVWHDETNGEWGTDLEIMYANYTGAGWSNATAISDIYGWNNGESLYPSIAVGGSGNVHVVWRDGTSSAGEWGSDIEIMYANYTASGWSNATAISDLYGWNNGISDYPSVAVDGSGNIHVVWEDYTDGEWGFDREIMYINYTAAGWSNATAISDIYGWNNGISYEPSVAVGGSGNVHVVWCDNTLGEWGSDIEIMYAILTERPTSNHPADFITITSGSIVIYWKLYDESGPGQYRVWLHDMNDDNYYLWVNWTPWTNGTYIIVDIAMAGLGKFNYTIEFYDFYHQFGISDSVIVTITDYLPTPTKDEPIIIAPQGGGDISSFLLSPLSLGIIAGVGAILLILVAVVLNNNKAIKEFKKTVQELNKKISKPPTSKKAIEK